jgi:hypothetical protein
MNQKEMTKRIKKFEIVKLYGDAETYSVRFEIDLSKRKLKKTPKKIERSKNGYIKASGQ